MIFALWFALMGVAWTYNAALVIAYPFGLLSLLIWLQIKKDGKARNRNIPLLLTVGLGLSLIVLASFLIFD